MRAWRTTPYLGLSVLVIVGIISVLLFLMPKKEPPTPREQIEFLCKKELLEDPKHWWKSEWNRQCREIKIAMKAHGKDITIIETWLLKEYSEQKCGYKPAPILPCDIISHLLKE